MAEIKVLTREVADKIAAGEVVERPSAVVKELVENSIDAGADRITVEVKNGGITYISIADNGRGIPKDQLETAFLRHATSKLRDIDDLFEISTMGFRGEALPSIAAVATVRVVSRTSDEDEGACMTIEHGVASEKQDIACNVGTTMVVENIFANVPARMKFLKKDASELSYITDILGRIALSKPEISFRYIADGKEFFSTSGDGSLKNAILNIYGLDHAKNIFEVSYSEHGVRVSGAVGKTELARGNRTRQTLFVNGRYIKNHVVSKVVEEAYRNILMTGKFPFFVLNIEISPQLVDVNVHPAKTEIKFANEKEVYGIVHCAVKNALYRPSGTEKNEERRAEKVENAYLPRFENQPDRKIIKEFLERTIPVEKEIYKGGTNSFKESRDATDKLAGLVSEAQLSKNRISGNLLTVDDLDRTPKNTPNEEVQLSLDLGDSASEEADLTASVKVIGQLFDTYIIAEQNDKMFLIDQHAAHERKRFEMLKNDYEEGRIFAQVLLSPIVLDVEPNELETIKDNFERLSDMGFLIEEFGKGSVIIRETPYAGDEDEIKSLAGEVISVLSEGRPVGLLSVEERILDMVSCKYAIKANKKLSLLEMEGIVRDTLELENKGITTCPHGRPIKISYSKREIEKNFKRIV